MAADLCCLQGLEMTYPLADGVQTIFRNLELELELDGITVLLGRSGCGKTTLLRLLAGLEEPTAGSVVYYQQGIPCQPKIGMVFQESRLLPWLSVGRNILLSQQQYDPALAQKMMELVGLEPSYEQSLPNALSGGMAHRVAIARALAYAPDVLLMDEPFAALDYFTRMGLQQQLLSIHQQTGTAIVFVTHNVDEALVLARRILILQKGQAPLSVQIDSAYPREPEQPLLAERRHQILNLLKE